MLTPRCPKCRGEIYFSSSVGRWKCDSCNYVGNKTLINGGESRNNGAPQAVLSRQGRKVVNLAKKGHKAKKAKGAYTNHKAYSYKTKSGKTVHIAAHREKRR